MLLASTSKPYWQQSGITANNKPSKEFFGIKHYWISYIKDVHKSKYFSFNLSPPVLTILGRKVGNSQNNKKVIMKNKQQSDASSIYPYRQIPLQNIRSFRIFLYTKTKILILLFIYLLIYVFIQTHHIQYSPIINADGTVLLVPSTSTSSVCSPSLKYVLKQYFTYNLY